MELKQNAKCYNDLATKLSNVEHRSVLQSEEKNKFSDEFKRRDEEQNTQIMYLSSEVNSHKDRLNHRIGDTCELRRAFDLLQASLSKRESETIILEQKLKNEVDRFESLIAGKNLVEGDIQAITKDIQMIEEKQRLVDEDLNSMHGQIQKQKKQVNDLRERLLDMDTRIKESKNVCYDKEEDIKNAENTLKIKDHQIDELNTNIHNLDNEVNVVAKEEERLKDEIVQINEEIKETSDFNAEMARRKNMLLKEKQTVDENILEVDNYLNKNKMELNNGQVLKIANENELKHLQGIYGKMKAENDKLLEEMWDMTRVDEKVRRLLNREERAREVRDNSEKEMKVAAHLIKEAY